MGRSESVSDGLSQVQFRHVRRPRPVGALALSRGVPFALACTFACVGPSADRPVLRGSRSLPWVRGRARVSDAFVPALAPRPSREQAGNSIPLPASQRFVNLSGSGVLSSWPSLDGS